MNFSIQEKNVFGATRELLKESKVKITDTSLKNTFIQHPNFPSLLSIKDVLNSFEIVSYATRIDISQLPKVPLPLIGYCENGLGFIVIKKVENNNIIWYHNELGEIKDSINEFLSKVARYYIAGRILSD